MKLKLKPLAFALAALFGNATAHADAAGPNASADANADAATLDTVSVIGKGETRQVHRVTEEEQKSQPPGTSPLKVLEKLPGVHFEAADPWGSYEWSTRISLRGFNQNRLGFTLDDIPLGDMSYGNNNGLHISRALISENLGVAEVAEGSGALRTASTSNLGGTLAFHSSDPLAEAGARLAQTVGSDSTRRSYARLDTGDRQGFAAYVSGSYASTDKWKGDGAQEQTQFNGKAVYDWDGQHVGLLVTTSRRDEVDYADLSLDSQRRLGWDWDNYAPDWQRAVDAAHGVYTGGVNSLDDAYYLGRGLRDDNLVGLNGEFALADNLQFNATAYYHDNRGQGHWFTPYAPSSATVPISIRTTEYDIERTGFIASLAYTLGAHRIEGGFWTEDSAHGLQRNYYAIPGPVADDFYLEIPDVRGFQQRFDTSTRQYYLQDTLTLMDDRLTIDAGFKSPHVKVDALTFIGDRAAGSIEAKKNFLPQLGVDYRFTDTEDGFVSYASNQAAFQPGVGGPFSATQAAFDAFAKGLKPERSKTLEAGVRSEHDTYSASAAVYTVHFDNRLLAIAQCSGIAGCPTAFANVGSVRTQGAEFTFLRRAGENLQWFNSLSYNDSTYRSDYLDGTTLVPADGKQVVDSPKQLFATELRWKDGAWDARLGGKYTGKRYITYVNDSSVAGYWVFDASAGYEVGRVGPLAALRLSVNVSNLADKKYFGTVGSNGFVSSDPQGLNYTLLTGAPRQVFFSADAKF